MLDLRDKRIEELPVATLRLPVKGRFLTVSGYVVAQTYETDPMLDVRLQDGAIVHVRESEAEIQS